VSPDYSTPYAGCSIQSNAYTFKEPANARGCNTYIGFISTEGKPFATSCETFQQFGGEAVGANGMSDVRSLPYGSSLTYGDVTFISQKSGVTCINTKTGHGFTIALDSYKLF
jgi:hypothetical protein